MGSVTQTGFSSLLCNEKILLLALTVSAIAATLSFNSLTPDSSDSLVVLQQKTLAAILENTAAVTNTTVSGGSSGATNSASLAAALSDELGSGNALFSDNGMRRGVWTNNVKEEVTMTTLTASGSTITLSYTNGGAYRYTLSADTTIALGNTTGTNRTIVLYAYPDGTHSFTWPSGVQALTPTNQPFAVGLTTIYFDRIDGTNYVSVSPDPSTYLTPNSTNTLTNKTFDAAGTGNVLKFTDYKDFIYPSRVDGTGCIIGTTNTANVWGLASYSGSADTNGNYAIFRIGTVPYDLDTSVAMTLKGFSIRVDGSDTDAAEFTIALYSPASSAAGLPTDFTGFSTFINFDSGALTSPALGDTFYFSDVTLTGWAAALTAGRPFLIAIARRNGSNDDIVSITAGTIEYQRTK